jgi:hypothetical protein
MDVAVLRHVVRKDCAFHRQAVRPRDRGLRPDVQGAAIGHTGVQDVVRA